MLAQGSFREPARQNQLLHCLLPTDPQLDAANKKTCLNTSRFFVTDATSTYGFHHN